MITGFITSANGGATKVELSEKTKKVYNILGDYPETIANYCVPKMIENTVIVWLGGHALHFEHTKEFNMIQDVAAARIVMGCGVPFVQLPCEGVVSAFTISKPELEYWFKGKNKLCDYLCENAIETAEAYAKGKPWTRCIWDVTAVGWLLNDNRRFMSSRLFPHLSLLMTVNTLTTQVVI
jgi:inosine-uridine nucleoside N-ribohydrolase